MLLIPAIDLKNGHCVRLLQGEAETKTVYSNDPVAKALSFENKIFNICQYPKIV